MELVGVRVELPTNAPIVLLRETSGLQRMLPIFIGGPEATAIAFALEEHETPRPMTHDLMRDMLVALGVNVTRIDITELRDHTFYAEIELEAPSGTQRVSARPSDAIALAARTGTPIRAAEAVLDEAAFVGGDEPEDDDVVDEFREFIEQVNPEDFAS